MTITRRCEQRVGYVEIGHPAVYGMGLAERSGLLGAVHWAEKEGLERVIVSGVQGTFNAGEDVLEFDSASAEPHLSDVLNAIDRSFVPWIAAIDGDALGGAAELAMACHMRIIAPNACMGLPETTLGVIPGAGGTQRLPRLVGLALALDVITSGKPVDAATALAAGLVHAVDEEPVEFAFMVNSEELSCRVPARDLPAPEMDAAAVAASREYVSVKKTGQIAPVRAIDVIVSGLSLSFDEGIAIERQVLLDLCAGEQAKALRHVYSSERAARGHSDSQPCDAALKSDTRLQGHGDLIGNRILARYQEAADTLLMDGSTPWEIDEAMVDFGYAMGPYVAQDLEGLDIAHANRRRQEATRDPARRYIPIADRMIELGKLGRKTGAGWYRYPGGGRVEDPIVADLGIEEAHFAGVERVDYSKDEIQRRIVLAMINEAADLLQEGVAVEARDIDLVTVYDTGFPRWRGGLMHYADTLGVRSVVEQLQQLAEEDPVAWKVSSTLKYCVSTGRCLADAKRL